MLFSLLKISGHSMEPSIKNGSIVIISSVPYFLKKPKIGEIVVFENPSTSSGQGKMFVKRIKKVNGNKFYVEGDNKSDSLEIGWIENNRIIGKVLFSF